MKFDFTHKPEQKAERDSSERTDAAHSAATSPFDGGQLLTEYSFANTSAARKLPPDVAGDDTSQTWLERTAQRHRDRAKPAAHDKAPAHDKVPAHAPAGRGIPNVNDMLQAGEALGPIATGDSANRFHPNLIDESEFKTRYQDASIKMGQQHKMSADQVEEALLGHYAIEGGGWATYDTQSGAKRSLSAPDPAGTDTNEQARRNLAKPLSSAIGYNQIIISTNLNLIDADAGTVASALRAQGKDDKAQFFETLQGKLHNELLQFAAQDKKNAAGYFDNAGHPTEKLYKAFAGSNNQTDLGVTGKQFSMGLQSLLLDGDVGPLLQAKQFITTGASLSSPEFQRYLESKARAYEARTKAVDDMLETARCHMMSPKELKAAQKKTEALVADHKKIAGDVPQDLNPVSSFFANSPVGTLVSYLSKLKAEFSAPRNYEAATSECVNILGGTCNAAIKSPNTPLNKIVGREAYRKNGILHGVTGDGFVNRIEKLMKTDGPGSADFRKHYEEWKAANEPADKPGP